MTIGISPERFVELRNIVDKEIENLQLNYFPSKKDDIAILFEHEEEFDAEEIQYMYDYLEEKNIFKNVLILPSKNIISTMTVKDLTLWSKHINNFLIDNVINVKE